MENQINRKGIEDYCAEVAELIISKRGEGKKSFSGEDLKKLSGIKQADRFVLEQIFSSWEEQMLQSRSEYFNYDNEQIKKAGKDYANALSYHIDLDPGQTRELYTLALEKALIFFFLPDLFLLNEFGSSKDPKAALKKGAPYLVFYTKECREIMKRLEEGMDFESAVADQEFGEEDQSGIISIEQYKELEPEIIFANQEEKQGNGPEADQAGPKKIFEKFEKEPSVLEKFEKTIDQAGFVIETEETALILNNLGLNEKLYFSKQFFSGNKFVFDEFLELILKADSLHDAREKFNAHPEIDLHGQDGMDARNKFFDALERHFS